MTSLPKSVSLVEVGPRDGLQNVTKLVSADAKVEFIRLLADAGLPEIEAGSFVNPKAVPAMADSEDVFERLKSLDLPPTLTLTALVPNVKGLEIAQRAGVKKIAFFTAASDAFTLKNTNCTIDESFRRIEEMLKDPRAEGMAVRGYVSTAFVCPYAGRVAAADAARVIRRLYDLGITDLSVGDTVGRAHPEMVRELLELLLDRTGIPKESLAMHFHDTEGRALRNIHESLKFNVTKFDASAGGLGGCPYAPGASGNVATNDVVAFLNALGIETGVDLDKLNTASRFIQNVLGQPLTSRVLRGEALDIARILA